MKRVGIVTFYFSDNYGAALQSWALQRWFMKRGCIAEFVPYHPAHVEEGGEFFFPTKFSDFRKLAKIAYLKISFFRLKYFGDKKQKERFARFRADVLGIGNVSGRTKEALKKMNLSYDLIVCGSDQIWNPSDQYGVDSAYYGEIPVVGESRRISYAASFGTSDVDLRWGAEISENVCKLDSVSVREPYGVKLVSELTKISPALVPDPVILYGSFDELLERAEEIGPIGIFCYSLRSDAGTRELASLVSESKRLDIVSAHNPHRRWREIGRTLYCGPCEWVAALKGAEYVVTNSFHGAVFSILMKKNFVTVGLPGVKAGLNDRVLSLLGGCGLLERFVEAENYSKGMALFEKPIDWSRAEEYLSEAREFATCWLIEQLELAGENDRI